MSTFELELNTNSVYDILNKERRKNMDFDFFMPVRVYSGKGAVMKNSDVFPSYGRVCGIVTGHSSAAKSGALEDVRSALDKFGIKCIIYDKITENPLIKSCHEAGRIFRENSVDFIVGIGGGSPLDASKTIAIYAANGDLSPKDIYLRKYENEPLPVLLIGTTAGTGSEVTGVSVLTSGETGRKKSISGTDCYAKAVFADSSYTCSMPYGVTVSTALDAFSHAVEGYFSAKYNDISELFADKAMPMLWECLKKLDETKALPDEDMRERLYYGSLYAGMVLNKCGTLFPHPLGYVLTENFNIPHGKACAAFMRDLIDIGYAYEREKTERLMTLLNTTGAELCAVVERLTDLPNISMTQDQIDEFCSRWDNSIPGNFANTPNGFSKDDAKRIFKRKFADK